MSPTNCYHAPLRSHEDDRPVAHERKTSHTESTTKELKEDKDVNHNERFDLEKYEAMEFKPQVRWPDMIVQVSLHLVTMYAFYRILTFQVKFLTVLYAAVLTYVTGFGITAGAHRLWSHRAYRAGAPLRVLLAFLFSITGQRDLYTWALDHRVHHKYSETCADPHDARRGFWFAHVGWLVLTPHPAVEDRRRELRAISTDLLDDPVIYWQKIFNIPLFALLNIGLPTWLPTVLWDETLVNGFLIGFVARFTVTLNIAFCVNSVAHFWGNKPYDSSIKPVENAMVSAMAMGEGWHNFHHAFPWDYRTSELGRLNPSTRFIDFMAYIGWASDRKAATAEMVDRRSQRCGDGSTRPGEVGHPHACGQDSVWGFGDPDMPVRDKTLMHVANAIQ